MAQTLISMTVKTLESQAYERMRRNIITGEWAQGSHLKDNEIANQLGISATPVREALRKLASEGLVETVPYRGTFVISLSAAQVDEVMTVRSGLETMAIEAGLSQLTDDQLDELRFAIRDFDRALANDDLPACLEADMTFHRLLVRSCKNGVLDELYRQLAGRVQMLMAIADIGGRMSTGNRDHEEILEAIQTRDIDATLQALRKHLIVTRDAILANWPLAEAKSKASNVTDLKQTTAEESTDGSDQ